MTTGNTNGNPYGQYGNGEVPNPAETGQGEHTSSYSAGSTPQQEGSGYGSQVGAQGYTGYGTSQPQYSDASTSNYQVPSQPSTQETGYSQYPGGYPAYGVAGTQKPKGLAIASMVLGILGFISGWVVVGGVFALVAIVLGIVALLKTKTGGGGKGFAITGIVTGTIGLLVSILMLALFGWAFAALGPALEACAPYSDDSAQFEQCLNEQMGLESGYSSDGYQNS